MIMDKVSARINQILKERKMTKFDLFKKCENVSRSSVYNAANGKSKVSIVTIDYICKGLEMSVPQFFNWNDEQEIHLTAEEREIIMACRGMNDDKLYQRLMGYIERFKSHNMK